MICCRCNRPLTAAAAWRDPVATGPGTAIPGALGPVCARKEGLAVVSPTKAGRRSTPTRTGKPRKAKPTSQLSLVLVP